MLASFVAGDRDGKGSQMASREVQRASMAGLVYFAIVFAAGFALCAS